MNDAFSLSICKYNFSIFIIYIQQLMSYRRKSKQMYKTIEHAKKWFATLVLDIYHFNQTRFHHRTPVNTCKFGDQKQAFTINSPLLNFSTKRCMFFFVFLPLLTRRKNLSKWAQRDGSPFSIIRSSPNEKHISMKPKTRTTKLDDYQGA